MEYVSDRMYKILKGRWWDIVLLNVPAPTEDKDVIIDYSFTKN
jgi:hypothetical protein